MLNQLIEQLDKLQIRVYTLEDGSQIIGELLEVHTNSIELKGVYNILEGDIDEDLEMELVLMPVVPYSSDEISIIYTSKILIDTAAPLELKKHYYDAILMETIDSLDGFDVDENTDPRWNNKHWNI